MSNGPAANTDVNGLLVQLFESFRIRLSDSVAELQDLIRPDIVEQMPPPSFSSFDTALESITELSRQPDLPSEYSNFFASSPEATYAATAKNRI